MEQNRQKKGESSLFLNWDVHFLLPLTLELLVLGLSDSGIQISSPSVLRLQDSDGIISLTFQVLQLADGRFGDFLASTDAQSKSYNKFPYLSIYLCIHPSIHLFIFLSLSIYLLSSSFIYLALGSQKKLNYRFFKSNFKT